MLLFYVGVLWFSHKWLEDRGCKKDLQCDNQSERDKLAELVDSMISCEIPEEDKEDDEKNMLRDYVLEVQQHSHTKTCEKKKKNECRFDFPKLVSEKTLLAIPIGRLLMLLAICWPKVSH